mmetsp:Transcript_40098/g.74765  ORF Transcript_40098/g.74765 Transcript_40098/m.74765 type:complete len:168 (+) Transcript_40098:181-684(+)
MASGLKLVEALQEWHWNSNCFHDHVVHFARSHQGSLMKDSQEHTHELFQLHGEFKNQLEQFVSSFLDHYGASFQDLEAALLEAQASDDLYVCMSSEVVREELLALLEYQAFHETMMRALSDASVGTGCSPSDPPVAGGCDADTNSANQPCAEHAIRQSGRIGMGYTT